MNSLKELNHSLKEYLQNAELRDSFPDFQDVDYLRSTVQIFALEMIPQFIPDEKLDEFMNISDENMTEETFKKYIIDYPSFLEKVRAEFIANLLLS